MKRLVAVVLAACILGFPVAASASWIFDADAGVIHETNVGLAQKARDVKSDSALSTALSTGLAIPLDDRTIASITGDLSGNGHVELPGLSNLGVGLTTGFRHKFGLGPSAPWLRLFGSGARLEFDDAVRDSWRYRLGAGAGMRLGERWDVRVDYVFEERALQLLDMSAAILCLAMVMMAVAAVAAAAELNAVVKDQNGEPVSDAVVVAVPRSGPPPRQARVVRDTVDQIDKEFVPYVKAVVVGSPVFFPNKDNIRHHVYSFSPAKTFELPLYSGTPANPVVFDRPGIVTIGCNIHDWMIAFIYVAETPWFGTTGRQGRVRLDNLPPGPYAVRVWQPRMEGSGEATTRAVTIGTGPGDAAWQLTLRQELRPRRAPVPGQRGYR